MIEWNFLEFFADNALDVLEIEVLFSEEENTLIEG